MIIIKENDMSAVVITKEKLKELVDTFPETRKYINEMFPDMFPDTEKIYCGQQYLLRGERYIFAHTTNSNEYGFLNLETGFFMRDFADNTIIFTRTKRRDSRGYYVEVKNEWLKKYDLRYPL